MTMTLLEKIESRTAHVGVVGLGYVGLPLSVEKARAGFTVLGFDIRAKKVDRVNRGENYIGDVVPEELAEMVRSGHLSATTSFDRIAEVDVVTICVPTPLDHYKMPDLSIVRSSAQEIAKRLHKDMLVVLESTTYPGTTEEVVLPILEATGLKCGRDFHLAFSPERVDPGNIKFKTKNTPKVVGGVTPECTRVAKALYEAVLDAPVFDVSTPKEAEMTKILENTYRIVNCALANEMAQVCHRLGINVWEVIEAASTKPFGFTPFTPGPGVGGHCIPIDPYYLTYRARAADYHTRLIEMAGDINDEMPPYVVSRLQDMLNDVELPMKGSRILLLGLAYKGDIDDMRESPAIKVWELLERKGAIVTVCDPWIERVNWKGACVNPVPLSEKIVEESDAVLITTGHTSRVNYGVVLDKAKRILDTRDILIKLYPQEALANTRLVRL